MFGLKKYIALFIFGFLLLPFFVSAQYINQTNIYFFWGQGCPHCAKEEAFLNTLKDSNPQVNVIDFEVYNNADNLKLLQTIGQQLKLDISGVPLVMVGEQVMVGYLNDETSGAQIKDMVNNCLQKDCADVIAPIIAQVFPEKPGPQPQPAPEPEEDAQNEESYYINLPLFGKIDVKNFSLPILTIIIAAIDGFNPCAMWVLLFLISLLLGMANKKRMWILGSAFILASGMVYFLFLSAWLNLFLFIGFIFWVRILIGLVAVGSGVYHLWDFYQNHPGCKLVKGELRDKVFTNLKFITQIPSFWLALIGIIIVAFAVNLIELVCSAGLPAIYTNVLSLSDISVWQYYLLLALYIIFFMLDDMAVFVIAMVTLQATGISTKYARYANLIGGIIILILGILLILKPELLMFS